MEINLPRHTTEMEMQMQLQWRLGQMRQDAGDEAEANADGAATWSEIRTV